MVTTGYTRFIKPSGFYTNGFQSVVHRFLVEGLGGVGVCPKDPFKQNMKSNYCHNNTKMLLAWSPC